MKYIEFHKISDIFFALCILATFLVPANADYAQSENMRISPQEIEKTLENVKTGSTTNKTFLRRAKVLEAWCILLVASGKESELRPIAPPESLSEIIHLKQNGKEAEAFNRLDHLYVNIEKLGIPQVENARPDLSFRDYNSPPHLTSPLTNPKYDVRDQKKSPVTANMSMDFLKVRGIFSSYIFGAISGPYFDPSGFNLAQNAGFKLITVFVDSTKPLPSDVNNPSQYDFALLDKQVEAILNIGAEPMVIFSPVRKPLNLENYSIYTQNVAKHLTQGWGNGHRWHIELFRFGNEPDNPEFWKDTQQNFFETYAAWAKTLKRVNPDFILVAPGLMQVRTNFKATSLNAWTTNFLEYCNTHMVPIDYFSFHAYSPMAYYFFYENSKLLKSELQKYPKLSPLYGIPRLANDEWQIKLGDLWSGSNSKQFNTVWAAAQNINALINMVEQGVQLSVPMTGTFNGGEKGCHDFLLVDCHGHGKPSFYAFKGFNWLYGTMQLSVSGTDHMNFAAIAGKNSNGVTIVFSNYDIVSYLAKYESSSGHSAWNEYYSIPLKGTPNIYNKFQIAINNLPWHSSQQVVYEHYLVDDTHNLARIESKSVPGNANLFFTGDIAAPSVHVIKLYLK